MYHLIASSMLVTALRIVKFALTELEYVVVCLAANGKSPGLE